MRKDIDAIVAEIEGCEGAEMSEVKLSGKNCWMGLKLSGCHWGTSLAIYGGLTGEE
ncbi:hypothetical protein O5903_24685 [Escherichia coli]|nr:hypothetical protein [Escherichia coli]